MAVRIQFRRGSAAEWTSANPTLAAGELGYESDTGALKIGNATDSWVNLAYGAVSEAYVNSAIADVVGLSPADLDTLQELASSIGNDAHFANTITENISSAVSTHESDTTAIHGIADTAELETLTGAQTKADAAQANAQSYADSAVSSLVDSSPATLDTLNELAAALGDDPNFATTISNTIGTKLSYVVDTAANFSAANVVTATNTIYIESDANGSARIGDGVTAYNDIASVGKPYTDASVSIHNDVTLDVHGIANTANLVYQSELAIVEGTVDTHIAAELNVHGITNTASLVYQSALDTVASTVTDHAALTLSVHGIPDVNDLVYQADLDATDLDVANVAASVSTLDSSTSAHAADTLGVHGIANTAALITDTGLSSQLLSYATLDAPTFTTSAVLPAATTIGEVTAAEIAHLSGVTEPVQTQITALASDKLNVSDALTTYAPIDSATLTGTVVLPTTTSIGTTTSDEITYLSGVSSAIQTQIDGKLAVSAASTTYAPIASPTFTGTVVLPATTSIDGVSGTEISYLNNVTSAIQTQINDKAPTANPTFTGTVAGVTAAMVGLANVDNTADVNKPVSTATQTALDLKADLAAANFVGNVEVGGSLVVDGDFTVNGSNFVNSATSITIEDNIVLLASGNAGNVVDLGLVVLYNDGVEKRSGLVRDVSDDTWKLFDGVTSAAGTTVAFAEGSLDNLSVNNITAAGVVFSDGTQTLNGIPSITPIAGKTGSYTLSSLTERDSLIEVNSGSASTVTIPEDSTLNFPVGTTLDILQTGAGQVTIAGASGVTVNATPGLKLRTQWSSVTLLKRSANLWVVYGDTAA